MIPVGVVCLLMLWATYRAMYAAERTNNETPFRQSIALMKRLEKSYTGQQAICSSLYGQRFIDGLIVEPICPSQAPLGGRSSGLTCLSRPLPKVLHSHGEKSSEIRLCTMENALISPMSETPFRFMYPVDCVEPPHNYKAHNYGHCNKGLFPRFCQFANNTPPLQPTDRKTEICEHYVNHTVLWLARGSRHIYHSFIEDYFAMAYFAMVVSGEDPRDAQLMIVDIDERDYDSMEGERKKKKKAPMSHQEFEFNVLFGRKYSVPQRVKPNTCFRKSIFSLGPWYLPYQSSCPSAFAYGFRHWIMTTLELIYPV